MSALSHGFTMLRATAGCRLLMKTVEVFGGCDCGGKVVLDVEAVSPRGVIDRRVLTADVDARLGVITCVRKWVSLTARLHSF